MVTYYFYKNNVLQFTEHSTKNIADAIKFSGVKGFSKTSLAKVNYEKTKGIYRVSKSKLTAKGARKRKRAAKRAVRKSVRRTTKDPLVSQRRKQRRLAARGGKSTFIKKKKKVSRRQVKGIYTVSIPKREITKKTRDFKDFSSLKEIGTFMKKRNQKGFSQSSLSRANLAHGGSKRGCSVIVKQRKF